MSLRAFAQKSDLDRGYLSRIERGLIRQAADERVQKVANALNVCPEAITHEEQEEK